MSQSNRAYPPGGVLFSNQRKTIQTHPDYTGNLEIGADLLAELNSLAQSGQPIKMDLSAWIKAGREGKKFLTLAARRAYVPNQQQGAPQSARRPATPQRQMDMGSGLIDDEIPF